MPKTLVVYSNPYLHVDHEGRPAGAVPTDPEHTGTERRWVGARLCPKRTQVTKVSPDRSLHESEQNTVFSFDDEPVTVPFTHYYLERIRQGELVAANAPTALAASVKFEPIADVRGRAKAAASKAWKAERGEDLPDHPTKTPPDAPETPSKAPKAAEK